MKFGFGRRLKPRKFDYIPRFYDETKDNLDAQISKFKGDPTDEEKIKARIKSGMRQTFYGDSQFRAEQTKKSNMRLVYIILILCMITYFILKSDKISKIIESLG